MVIQLSLIHIYKVQFMIDGKPYDVDIVMAENGSCSILHDGNSFNAEPVSYTHLDVYKRQVPIMSPFLFMMM